MHPKADTFIARGVERAALAALPRPATCAAATRCHNLLVNTARFRRNVSISIAGLVAFLGAVPVATSGFGTGSTPWWAYPLLLILLVPIAIGLWGWRSGTDADAAGVRIRAVFGSRRIAWSEIAQFQPDRRRVNAVLVSGELVDLPAVTRADLPRLIAASGNELMEPAAQ